MDQLSGFFDRAFSTTTAALQKQGVQPSGPVEDCRHLTRRLEPDLIDAGHSVVRVHTRLMAGMRRSGREPGKSDPIGAEAVARVALLEEDLPVAELPGRMRELKLLSDHRRSLVATRTALQSEARWFLHEIDPDLSIPSRPAPLRPARGTDRQAGRPRGAR